MCVFKISNVQKFLLDPIILLTFCPIVKVLTLAGEGLIGTPPVGEGLIGTPPISSAFKIIIKLRDLIYIFDSGLVWQMQ